MYVNDKNFEHPDAVNAAMKNLITAIAKEYSHVGCGINRQWIADAYNEFHKENMDKFIENITTSMCGRLHINNPKGAILIIHRVYPKGEKVMTGYAKHDSFEDAIKVAINENLTYNREYTIIDLDNDEVYNHNQIERMLARFAAIKCPYRATMERYDSAGESIEVKYTNVETIRDGREWLDEHYLNDAPYDGSTCEIFRIMDIRPYAGYVWGERYELMDGSVTEFRISENQ